MDIKKILFKTNSFDVEKSMPDAVMFCTTDGKIQWINDLATEIFDTSKMHLLTVNIDDIIENAINIITNSDILKKPVIVKLKDKEVYYEMTSRKNEEGYVLVFRFSAMHKNINENNGGGDEINREKNNFILKLSNDFKAPVQSIVGFSQAMADGLGGQLTEQQEKYVKIIKKNSSELMYFISKFLELSGTETMGNTINPKTLDIVSLINSVVKFNEQLYKGKDIKISINADETLKKTINTDEELLKFILQDILEVIFKVVDMGEININISTPDEEYKNAKELPEANYTLIKVATPALLLTENDLECMFDPYKIVDTTNRKNVLRAMALASARNMVSRLNGLIWVESQILKNTCFNLLIPEIVKK